MELKAETVANLLISSEFYAAVTKESYLITSFS